MNKCAFSSRGGDLHNVLPLWGFGATMLAMYLPFARVSVQEWAGYSYASFYGDLVLHWALPPLIMIFVVTLQQAEKGNDDAY